MVFLGPDDGEIEVRLVKPPFGASEPERVYFDEYEKLGTPHRENPSYECSRYLASENTTYGVEITLRKGFRYGNFDGVACRLHDKAMKAQIGSAYFPKVGAGHALKVDKKLFIETLSNVIVDGRSRDNVHLAFFGLVTDEELSKETDVPGINPADVGDFQIEVYKYKLTAERARTEAEYQSEMEKYKARLAAQASKIDGKSFTKDGVTHKLRFEGGVEKGPSSGPSRMCHAHTCSKEIYDKEHVLTQKISEAGSAADTKAIRGELFETGERPIKWMPWGNLLVRERPGIFKKLQLRRTYFEKGEYPPEEQLPGSSSKPALVSDEPSPQYRPVVEPVIKKEHIKSSPLPKSRPTIIILDDSPPRNNKRPVASISDLALPTIKAEPTEPINLLELSTAGTHAAIEGGPTKKIKLEQGAERTDGDEDKELLRLKEEDQRQEEELQIIQKMAEMIRQRNERKARIAALEARASATPEQGGHS